MDEFTWVYATASLIIGSFVIQVLIRKFDPFAPIWLFFVGYLQMYVIQALSYHEWAIRVRGVELVTEANFRAFWALAWMLAVYWLGPAKLLARLLPSPPTSWSTGPIKLVCPLLIVWGLVCAGVISRGADESGSASAEAAIFLSFPSVMLIAGAAMIVTGRQPSTPRPAFTAAGIATVSLYMLIWMFNGKRSHSLIAVLTGVCSFYLPRLKRPSFPVLVLTACAGMLAVGISIGWRFYANANKTHGSYSKFVDFVATFDPETILQSINMKDKDQTGNGMGSHETEEIGGFLLMMDTVPLKSDYDYGASYLRIFSTYIPRIVWQDKPYYGRDQWIAAWVAGSELKREANFTGPSIGVMGATQLNGGAWGTFIVMGVIGLLLRTGYEFFRRYQDRPWAQVWWASLYYNAWLMTVGDDPLTWFYYNYGFTGVPTMAFFYFINKLNKGA
jgi:hypothetical protein